MLSYVLKKGNDKTTQPRRIKLTFSIVFLLDETKRAIIKRRQSVPLESYFDKIKGRRHRQDKI